MRTLYVTDLDGTLLNTKDRINPESLRIINGLVKKGILSIERLLWMLTYGPSRVLGIPCGVVPGNRADLVFIDENTIDVVDSRRFYSMGKSTPFEGMETQGRVVRTVCQGKTVYREER